MRLPLFILCLAVAYGTCLSHGDVTEIQNGDYKVNLSDVPFERFHSRHKRSLLSPVTAPLDMILRLCGVNEGAITTSVNLLKFVTNALMGQDVCPKTEGVSLLGLIPQMMCHPVQTTEALTCHFLQTVGNGGRALTSKAFDLSVQIFRNIFLPGLHTTLNALKGTHLLPPQINAAIDIFNLIYKFLQIMGYVPN
ncbi:uncharacterized protein LOC105207450 [Solenopsis invicta]|uniref:uncharacterized protein LOC105207450 n=1 Tax=Solenopsis invicta TaxID=13686 RepID=UPI00193CB00A|nr:uncharacterized protein LOC105207450 [Solenopsis invicta]